MVLGTGVLKELELYPQAICFLEAIRQSQAGYYRAGGGAWDLGHVLPASSLERPPDCYLFLVEQGDAFFSDRLRLAEERL